MTDTLSVLENRKDLDSTKYSYKLLGNQYGMDVSISDEFDVDEKSMSCWIPFADGKRRDGVGDKLEVGGILTHRHATNPIILFDHGKGQHQWATWPIALAEDRETKAYTVILDQVNQEGKLQAFFYQGKGIPNVDKKDEKDFATFCEQLFDLRAKRFIRGGSIGYQNIKTLPLQADYELGIPQGLHLLQVLMLEASLVVLPANQDTVAKVLSMDKVCGKALSPILVKSLTPFAPEKKAQLGYEGKGMDDHTIPPANWKPGAGAECSCKEKKEEEKKEEKALPGQSYFGSCERDETGHCLPKGQSGRRAAPDEGKATPKVPEIWAIKHHKNWWNGKDWVNEIRDAKIYPSEDAAKDEISKSKLNAIAVKLKEKRPDVKDNEKSLQNKETKSMPIDKGTETPKPQGQVKEPLGAALCRSLHSDYLALMEYYDENLGLLDNSKAKDYLTTVLQGLEKAIGECEKFFGGEYKDLQGLEGAEPQEKAEPEPGEEATLEEENPEEGKVEKTEEVEEADSTKKKEPTPDEALEGTKKSMNTEQIKSLRAKYKSKEQIPAKAAPKPEVKEIPVEQKQGKALENPVEEKKPVPEPPSEEAVEAKPGSELGKSGWTMHPHHKTMCDEAKYFLKEVGETTSWEEEHRKKAYHHSKALHHVHDHGFPDIQEDIHGMDAPVPKETGGEKTLEATEGMQAIPKKSPSVELINKLKENIHGGATFLDRMHNQRTCGLMDQEEAKHWYKALDTENQPEEEAKEGEEETPKEEEEEEPGQVESKGVEEEETEKGMKTPETKRIPPPVKKEIDTDVKNLQQSFETRNTKITDLAKQLETLSKRLVNV